MREIKFRGWDEKRNKEMVYNINLLFSNRLNDCFEEYEEFGLKIMQYTGLKDKNGVLVYEGDIVEATRYDGLAVTGVVDFRDCSFVISTGYQTIYTWIDYQIEVIGNIYENQELLEESEQNDTEDES